MNLVQITKMSESYSPEVHSRDFWIQLPWEAKYADRVFIFIFMLLLLSSLNNVTSVAFNFVKSSQNHSQVLLIHLAGTDTNQGISKSLQRNTKALGTIPSAHFCQLDVA